MRPLSYRLELEIDPALESFSGRVVIDVELDTAAHPLWLNAEKLVIDAAELRAMDGGTERPLRVVPGDDAPNQIAIAAAMNSIEDAAAALPDRLRPGFRKLVGKSFGRLTRATGWSARPGDTIHVAAARRYLVPAVAVYGADVRLQKEAHALAMRWTDDRTAVPRDRLWVVLRTALVGDDGRLFHRLRAAIATEPDSVARVIMASALGQTHDPGLLRQALEHVASLDSTRSELRWVLDGPKTEALGEVRLVFLEERLPELLERVAADSRVGLAPSTCVAAHRARVVALLDAHFVALPDFGPSARDRAVARMDACIAQRENLARRLVDYFSSRAGTRAGR